MKKRLFPLLIALSAICVNIYIILNKMYLKTYEVGLANMGTHCEPMYEEKVSILFVLTIILINLAVLVVSFRLFIKP